MMGPEYFTVAGYTVDGAVVCRKCGDKAGLPVSDQITVAQAESDFQEDGLYCDTCQAEIVEPYHEEDDDECDCEFGIDCDEIFEEEDDDNDNE